MARFTFSLAELKIGSLKIGSMLVSTHFSLHLKINRYKTSQKVTKDKDPERVDAGRKVRERIL